MSNNIKSKTNQDPKASEIDFGNRKVVSQHFSRVITIPKDLLLNWNKEEAKSVNVKSVEENGQKFIKVIPIFDDKMKGA